MSLHCVEKVSNKCIAVRKVATPLSNTVIHGKSLLEISIGLHYRICITFMYQDKHEERIYENTSTVTFNTY